MTQYFIFSSTENTLYSIETLYEASVNTSDAKCAMAFVLTPTVRIIANRTVSVPFVPFL